MFSARGRRTITTSWTFTEVLVVHQFRPVEVS